MSERPILFSGAMVRAILERRKTQTRRVIKQQPPDDVAPITVSRYHPTIIDRHGDEAPGEEIFGAYSDDGDWGCKCPYGEPGDRLWVRESLGFDHSVSAITYAVDGVIAKIVNPAYTPRSARPSIHMPRWASRITLEITGVRAERLQDISEADARAEGVERTRPILDDDPCTYIDAYADLWDGLNAARGHGWDSNPWVWVIEFRSINP